MDTRSEVRSVKTYIRNLRLNVLYIKHYLYDTKSDEYKYYISMINAIDKYAKSHKLFYKYILGKITISGVKNLLGIPDREVYRYLEKQRKSFINFITTKEEELLKKYCIEELIYEG